MATSRPGGRARAARPAGASSGPPRTRTAPAARGATRLRPPKAPDPPTGADAVDATTSGEAPPPGRASSLTGRAAALALVCGVLVVSYAYPLRTWVEQRERISELHAEQARLTVDVERLRADIERWDDPAYVRAQARERLSFVLPGEISYIVIDPAEEAAAAQAPGDPGGQSLAGSPWWARLWSAVEVSGDLPAPDDAASRGASDPGGRAGETGGDRSRTER